jgi:hypothetical protein
MDHVVSLKSESDGGGSPSLDATRSCKKKHAPILNKKLHLILGGSSLLALTGLVCLVLGISALFAKTEEIKYRVGSWAKWGCEGNTLMVYLVSRSYGLVPVPHWLGGNMLRKSFAKGDKVPDSGDLMDVDADDNVRINDARAKRTVGIVLTVIGVFLLAMSFGLVAWIMSSSKTLTQ